MRLAMSQHFITLHHCPIANTKHFYSSIPSYITYIPFSWFISMNNLNITVRTTPKSALPQGRHVTMQVHGLMDPIGQPPHRSLMYNST